MATPEQAADDDNGIQELYESPPDIGTWVRVWTDNYALRLWVEKTVPAEAGAVVDDEVEIIGEGRGFETDADHGQTKVEVEDTADGYDAYVSYHYPDRSGSKRNIPVERVEVVQ
jgi:hypothetical protein